MRLITVLFYFILQKNIFFAFYGIWYDIKTQINGKEDQYSWQYFQFLKGGKHSLEPYILKQTIINKWHTKQNPPIGKFYHFTFFSSINSHWPTIEFFFFFYSNKSFSHFIFGHWIQILGPNFKYFFEKEKKFEAPKWPKKIWNVFLFWLCCHKWKFLFV